MQVLDYSKLGEDEDRTQYPPFLAVDFGRGTAFRGDDAYYTERQSGALKKNCIPTQHENIADIATQTTSTATISTLAIRSGFSMIPISDITWAVAESILEDDYADEPPLEIQIEPERKEPTKEPVYQNLYRIYRECSESSWDSYDATSISERAFIEATKFLDLLPTDVPLPEVTPEPTGEIAFEWYKGKKQVFVISVGGKNSISYAGLFGKYCKTYGTEYFIDEIPRLVVDNVLRLFR